MKYLFAYIEFTLKLLSLPLNKLIMRKLSLIVTFCHLLSLSACLDGGKERPEGSVEMLNGRVPGAGKRAEG